MFRQWLLRIAYVPTLTGFPETFGLPSMMRAGTRINVRPSTGGTADLVNCKRRRWISIAML